MKHTLLKRTATCLVVTALLAVQPAFASDITQGYRAFMDEQWGAAFDLWYPAAKKGDPRAQYYLSRLYSDGLGVSADRSEAFHWMSEAAGNGFPAAQYTLGNFYQHGRWVEQDLDLAIHWYSAAAEQGQNQAQYELAMIHLDSDGKHHNLSKGISMLRRAARRGSGRAKRVLKNLGIDPDSNEVDLAKLLRNNSTSIEAVSQRLADLEQQGRLRAYNEGSSGSTNLVAEGRGSQVPAPTMTPSRDKTGELPEDENHAPTQLHTESTYAPAKDVKSPTGVTSGESSLFISATAVQVTPFQQPKSDTLSSINRLLMDSQWLQKQESERYTFQIFSSRNTGDILEEANRVSQYGDVGVFPFMLYGQQWYGVTLGSYTNRWEAEEAAEQLVREGKVDKRSPWIRSLSDIKGLQQTRSNLDSQDWLLNQPADYYTLQVGSFSSMESALEVSGKLGDAFDTAIVTIHKKANRSFIVVAGSYASMQDAEQGAIQLKEQQWIEKPWIRNFADLRQ
ncbi:MAG: SPOR domain-containing protein [Candidatus Sedimenticola sp. 20ELBAFRAG]